LHGAEIANHKRTIPIKFDERLINKENRLRELESRLKEKAEEGKKTDSVLTQIEKTKLDMKLMKETKEYNLGTSLKSYIDPRIYVKWGAKVGFTLDKLYPKALMKKYAWALKNH